LKAVQLIARDILELREVPTPTPGPGELLIRVRAAGLCETDVHLYHMRWPVPVPLTLGH
jgi:D-arabinose 1-dehydrogenase-like Zn-dependent alcohol dehydrogenase